MPQQVTIDLGNFYKEKKTPNIVINIYDLLKNGKVVIPGHNITIDLDDLLKMRAISLEEYNTFKRLIDGTINYYDYELGIGNNVSTGASGCAHDVSVIEADDEVYICEKKKEDGGPSFSEYVKQNTFLCHKDSGGSPVVKFSLQVKGKLGKPAVGRATISVATGCYGKSSSYISYPPRGLGSELL